MSKSITSSAPGKLMLGIGYAVVHGWPTVVTAVDQRISVTVEERSDIQFTLTAPEVHLTEYAKSIIELGQGEIPKAAAFIETALGLFLSQFPQSNGVNVTTQSSFLATFGFGSSSASTVAFLKAISELYQQTLTNKQLFELCYQTILKVQGVGSGFDIAAAICGGTIYYVKPAKVVRPIEVDNIPIIIGYTGFKADTATLVKKVDQRLENEAAVINNYFEQIASLADQLKQALPEQDWVKVGKIFSQNKQLMQHLGVSHPQLEKLIDAAEMAGAYGAAPSGAGGGDCMIALVDDNHRAAVTQAIEQAGGQVLDVTLNAPGVKIEKQN